MSQDRLAVRVTISFFEDLDRQLRPERGPLGQPSRADFQAFELVEIIMASPQGSTGSRSSSLDVATLG